MQYLSALYLEYNLIANIANLIFNNDCIQQIKALILDIEQSVLTIQQGVVLPPFFS